MAGSQIKQKVGIMEARVISQRLGSNIHWRPDGVVGRGEHAVILNVGKEVK